MTMEYLKKFLDQEVERYKQEIIFDIERFISSEDKYWNIGYSDHLQLVIRKGRNEKLKSIGFPFPLVSYPLGFGNEFSNISINLYLRGKLLRDFQRNQLINELKQKTKISFIEINNILKFRELTKKLINKYQFCNYFDSYSFIGDSFIGLHFIENFINKFNIKLKNIYSENYLNLNIVAKTKGYIDALLNNERNIAIFSDLIDTHWERTKHIVKNLSLRGVPSIIIGRNLIIIPEDNFIKIYHYNHEDPLLKKENIEDYMNKCLKPYLIPHKNKFQARDILSKNIVINPFGSEANKNIPKNIIFELIKEFKKKYPKSKILVISELRDSFLNFVWCTKLKARLSGKNLLTNVIFKNYGSFYEIKKDLNKYKIALGITADTSIAHFFNYVGIRNITIFNLKRCDLNSPQSLASDSPLGFCRFGEIQFPVLLDNNNDKIISGIMGFIDYFLSNNKNTAWIDEIFDNKKLITKIGNEYPDLLKANKKINPEFKLKNDKIYYPVSN